MDAWLAGPAGTLLVNGAATRIPQELMLSNGQRVLDIGCGRGTLLRLLDDRVQFTRPPAGLEASRALLQRGREDAHRAPRPVLLTQGAPHALPFASDTFDIVTCGYVLRRLDDAQAASLFGEVLRVLRGGGLALLWDFAPAGSARLDAWNRRWLQPLGGGAHLRSTRSLANMARAAGFPFVRPARLRPFLLPPVPRASLLVGRPPEGYTG